MSAAAQPTTFAAAGGSGTLTVTTNRECQWNAAASGNWIQLGSPAGQGEASVTFSVNANPEPAQRRGSITIGEQQVAISQDAAPCILTVSPLADAVSPGGDRRTVTVTANGADCAWTARSEANWLSIVQGSQGTGSGQVVYEARATTGPSRTGALTVAGQRVTVTQGVGCSTGISPAAQTVGASGGSGAVSVTTSPGCPWSVQSETPWISITSPASGTGPAVATFAVGAWNGPSRTGTLRVNDQIFTVTQTAGCSFSISPASHSLGSAGGSGTVSVTTAAGCEWSATSNAPWIAIAGASGGNGGGNVQFTITPTTGPARIGTLTVAGHVVTVNQGSGCSITINPMSQPFGAGGGNGSFAVTAGPGCTWNATSSENWVRITSGANGSGNGTVQFSVLATNGPARTARVTVAGQVFTVQQSAGCSYSIEPAGQTVPPEGGSGSIRVTAPAGCEWTAAASETWVQITSGASGSGIGTINFTVAAGSSRTATISVGGRTFTIQQSAACSYSIDPTSQTFSSGGGNGSFAVSAAAGCGWNAVASESWVRITAGGSGNGGGTVQFTVEPHNGSARSATITVAGRTFTVQQSAGCSYGLNPTSATFGAEGGNGSVSVDTGGGCSWTATAADGWVRLTSGASGNGGGTVQFTVDANPGSAPRSTTLTIGGQAFAISQSGACAYDLNPASLLLDAGGGSGSFGVNTAPACSWTAASNDGWLQVTGGSSGSGPGTVNFTAAANTGPARTGTIVAGGRTFTASQASGCSISIAPGAQNFEVGGGAGTITVTTEAGCDWTASVTSGGDWISISGGASGSGSGAVQFTVLANAGPARSGTIAVGGQTFTVTQGGV